MTGDRLDELPPPLRAAVTQRLRGRGRSGGIRRRPHPDQPAPLSFAQQRLWLLHELFPDGLAYNVPSTHRLGGSLDVDALRRAFTEVLRRHEVLRSTFERDADGNPVQVVGRPEPFDLPVTPVPGALPAERIANARQLAVERVRRRFDLSQGPLLYAELLRLDRDDHVLVLWCHHIVTDMWSLRVLYGELSQLYASYQRDEPSTLPELPVQYADFAVWQRDQLTDERLRRHLSYWRQHLAGLEMLELRTDRPRPPAQSFAGARLRHQVPELVMDGVRELSAKHGTTTFMALLAALHTVLARHSATETADVTIATPIANRARPELEPLIGFFVNTLPIRTTPQQPNPSFGELLRHVRSATLTALLHQDLPFDLLVDHLRPHRTLSSNPIATVALSFLNAPGADLDLPGIDVRAFPIDPGTVVFDLDLIVDEADGGLTIALDYSTDLFDESTARQILGDFVELLQRARREASRTLAELLPRKPVGGEEATGRLRPATPVEPDLPARSAPSAAGRPAPMGPDIEVERALVRIWSAVLGVDRITATDDFFAIGGNSLAAARMAAQVSRQFGVKVPMRAVFDAPTIGRFVPDVLMPLLAGGPELTRRLHQRLAALSPQEALRVAEAARRDGPGRPSRSPSATTREDP